MASAWGPFLGTTSGLYTIYRMLGVVLLFILFQFMRKRMLSSERISTGEYGFFVILAMIDFARARVSHAAASIYFAPAFGVVMNFIHLYFKDVWIGGIIGLVVLLSPVVRRSRNLRVPAFALSAFSKIASAALGVAGVTGVYIVWLHLKGFSNLLTTDWGKIFVTLSLFAVFLMLLRFFHQLYVEPKLIAVIKTNEQSRLPRIFSWLGFTVPAEMVMGIAILAVTSLLIITTPPLAPHFGFARSTVSQGLTVSLTEQPDETGKFLVTVQDPLKENGPSVKNMVVALTNQAAGIGPILAPVKERFCGWLRIR